MKKFLIGLCAAACLFGSVGVGTMKLEAKVPRISKRSKSKTMSAEAKEQSEQLKTMAREQIASLQAANEGGNKKLSFGEILMQVMVFMIGVITNIGNVLAEAVVDFMDWISEL